MRYIERVSVKLPGIMQIKDDFELGDLSIFIGRSNSGKTRILTDIFNRLNTIQNSTGNFSDLSLFKSDCARNNIKLMDNLSRQFKSTYIQSPRNRVSQINALGIRLGQTATSLKVIDPSVNDVGNTEVQFFNDEVRQINEQGSGFQNMLQILNNVLDRNQLIFVDEPEISQFPYGKIELLKTFVGALESKQIIVATHDPTLINQYLIKQIAGDKNYKIIIYSFSNSKFNKIDFSTNCDPEIHVGYLSQTYSGKPVHLVLEGQTEFYLFQALLFKYCIAHKIKQFPKLLNKIALSYLAGIQWKTNLSHLPDVRFYDVAVLLDGEHAETSQNLPGINKVSSVLDFKTNQVNLVFLTQKNLEAVLGAQLPKPTGWAEKVWSISDKELLELEHLNVDTKLIFDLIRWTLEKANLQQVSSASIAGLTP